MVFRVEDLKDLLFSFVTSNIQNVTRFPGAAAVDRRHGEQGLYESSRLLGGVQVQKGLRKEHGLAFHCILAESFLVIYIFREREILVQGHRYNFAHLESRFLPSLESYLSAS